jgi:hypothetical protein
MATTTLMEKENSMKRKLGLIFTILMAFVMIASCAQIKALFDKTELTPAARYYDALKTFNSNVEQYNAIYKLSDATTQAKWKAEVDPLIKIASGALDSWKLSLNSTSAVEKEAVWNSAKTNLLAVLVASGIIKVEGGK